MDLTPVVLTGLAGILLAVAFEYFPGVSAWYEKLSSAGKRWVMAASLAVVTLAIFGLSCGGYISAGVTCDDQGIAKLVSLLILAIVANQSAHPLTKKTPQATE